MNDHILGILGALLVTIAVFEALRRGIMPERFAALWIIVTFVLLVVAIFPAVGAWAARIAGFALPINLLLFLAALLLLLVSVQFSYEIGKLDARTRRLAEEVALLRHAIQTATDHLSGSSGFAAPFEGDDPSDPGREPPGEPR